MLIVLTVYIIVITRLLELLIDGVTDVRIYNNI